MRADYTRWLTEQQYADNTKAAQLHRVKKVEESYGNLDEHFANGTYDGVINALKYSRADEKANKPNPSKIKFDGNIRNNLQSYKNAVVRYRKFLNDIGFQKAPIPQQDLREKNGTLSDAESNRQRLSLERDMQAALRRNIASLDPSLKIIDDGSERAVDSGLIDTLAREVQGGLNPDCTLLLDVPVKVGLARARARSGAAADRFEAETETFFERVRNGYLALARAEPDRIRVIDAAAELPAVERQIADILDGLVGEK